MKLLSIFKESVSNIQPQIDHYYWITIENDLILYDTVGVYVGGVWEIIGSGTDISNKIVRVKAEIIPPSEVSTKIRP